MVSSLKSMHKNKNRQAGFNHRQREDMIMPNVLISAGAPMMVRGHGQQDANISRLFYCFPWIKIGTG